MARAAVAVICVIALGAWFGATGDAFSAADPAVTAATRANRAALAILRPASEPGIENSVAVFGVPRVLPAGALVRGEGELASSRQPRSAAGSR